MERPIPLARELIRDNPWWGDPEAIHADVHLRRIGERALVFPHPLPFDLEADAAYTLRGPRQVGKTTLLKRMVRQLLAAGHVPARHVCYLDVGAAGIVTAHALQELLGAYLTDLRQSADGGRAVLLIDEVTGIEDWGVVIRALHGRGLLDGVTLVATGSHALDIRRGGERAPGRRGAVDHWDWVMMPLSFRDYLAQRDVDLVGRLPSLDALEPRVVFEAASEAEIHRDRLSALFDRYLLTGGYPHSTEAENTERTIPPYVYQLHQDAIRGEMVRAGYRERYFRELVSWVGHHRLGREFSWRDASGETELGSKDTVRRYIEDAQDLFVWHVFHRVKDPARPEVALRSPKKLYPADPFAWHVLSAWARGERDPWKVSLDASADPETRGQLVESVVADHLRRAFGEFACYHRDARGTREIDFVLFPGSEGRYLVEVKQGRRVRAGDQRAMAEAGGGVLVSRDALAFHEDTRVAVVPVASFLAVLGYSMSLYPAR